MFRQIWTFVTITAVMLHPYPVSECCFLYYIGMLRLGGTGKAIRPSHENSGIASVANITLMRLVTPLKVLNIDDKELELMKEIVLFNSGG